MIYNNINSTNNSGLDRNKDFMPQTVAGRACFVSAAGFSLLSAKYAIEYVFWNSIDTTCTSELSWKGTRAILSAVSLCEASEQSAIPAALKATLSTLPALAFAYQTLKFG